MLKTEIYYLIVLGVLCVFYPGCKDESEPEQIRPFFTFFDTGNIDIDTIPDAGGTWIYGFRFKTLRGGYIDQIGVKVPAIGTYKIRLYDHAFNQVLREYEIHSVQKHEEQYIPVDKVFLSPDSDISLSIVADVFFKIRNLNGAEFPFPQDKGSIRILAFNEELCTGGICPEFPGISNSSVIAPCVDFVFNAE